MRVISNSLQKSFTSPSAVLTPSRFLIPDDLVVRSQLRKMALPVTFNTDDFVKTVNQFFDNFNVNQLSPNHVNLFIQHIPINLIVDIALPDLCDFVCNIFRSYFAINWPEGAIENWILHSLPDEYFL